MKQNLPSLYRVFKYWNDERFRHNQTYWNWLAPEHRPGGKRFLHDDYPCWPLTTIPRTLTSFIIKKPPVMLEGNQTHWCNFDNGTVSYADKQPGERWGPKPWPLKGQWQRSLIAFYDPITEEEYNGIYYADVDLDGDGFRWGPRWTDPAVDSPWNNVNYMPFGTMQAKRIR